MFNNSKKISLTSTARAKLLSGINKLADCVQVTLGAAGRNVTIFDGFRFHITKDGVTVAKAVELEDLEEEAGARIIKDTAGRTNDFAGDGTTTAVVLARAIAQAGIKAVEDGCNPMHLKGGIEIATDYVVKYLEANTEKIDISSIEAINNITAISANGDKEAASLITEAISSVGVDGLVTIEESTSPKSGLEIVQGLGFDQGYVGFHFTTNAARTKAEHSKCRVMIFRGKLFDGSIIETLHPLLYKEASALLIIADDFDAKILQYLAINSAKGVFRCIPVKAPIMQPEEKRAVLEDIAVFTGATIIDETVQKHLHKLNLSYLGLASKVVCTQNTTTIIDGLGDKAKLTERLEGLRGENTEFAKVRLAKLTGGIAVINVGGATLSEIKEKRDRVEDAVNSAKAALKQGTIPGGGTSLWHASKYIAANRNLTVANTLDSKDSDFGRGFNILLAAIQQPIKTIIANSGENPIEIISLLEATITTGSTLADVTYGYDVISKEIVNMREAGIIDPVLVTITALKNAASSGGLIITTEALLSPNVKEGAKGMGNPFMGMMNQ